MSRAGRAAALALVLAGCSAGGLPMGKAAKRGAEFSPDPQGLSVVGTGQRVDFGRAPAGVIAALDRELGAGKALGLAGCPTGVVSQRDWNGLVLSFTAERFVGWRQGTARAGQTCG